MENPVQKSRYQHSPEECHGGAAESGNPHEQANTATKFSKMFGENSLFTREKPGSFGGETVLGHREYPCRHDKRQFCSAPSLPKL